MELRPYQQQAKDRIFEEWDSGNAKTLLVLPTGCGKTIVFAKVTEDCVRLGGRVLILAHRGALLLPRKSGKHLLRRMVPRCCRLGTDIDA